jgi:hypothetical protein
MNKFLPFFVATVCVAPFVIGFVQTPGDNRPEVSAVASYVAPKPVAQAASISSERADELLTAAAALRHERDCPGSQPQYFIERRERMKAIAITNAKFAKVANNSIDTLIRENGAVEYCKLVTLKINWLGQGTRQ